MVNFMYLLPQLKNKKVKMVNFMFYILLQWSQSYGWISRYVSEVVERAS